MADDDDLHCRVLLLVRVRRRRRRRGEEDVAGVPDLDAVTGEQARCARRRGLRRERRVCGEAGENLGLLLQHLGR